MTVHIKPIEVKLTWIEQQELQRFLRNPQILQSCPADSERIIHLNSLIEKGYISLELEEKGYNYYKLKEA